MNRSFVLICSGQLSLNPRIVKEADSLYDSGYDVKVIYLYWNKWGRDLDEKLLEKKKWKAICAGGDPDNGMLVYGITRVVYKVTKVLARNLGFRHNLAELAIGRGTWLLAKEAYRHPADIYIAHNLAALPIAVKAARKNNSKCGFDAEDFYRNDVSDDAGDFGVRLKKFIEAKYYPQADYITASSEDIANAYGQIFPLPKSQVILNVFPKNKVKIKDNSQDNKRLKLFWFSQSVGLSRGLQDIISAMKILEKEDIEFHILGDLAQQVETALNCFIKSLDFRVAPRIVYHKPIDPDELVMFASQFDIGLATEPGFSTNNNIALSNKLFTYINAGLAIIASDTIAQSRFLKKYPVIGKVYPKKDSDSLAKLIAEFIKNGDSLCAAKQASYLLGQNELNWENESEKFIRLIKETLNTPPIN